LFESLSYFIKFMSTDDEIHYIKMMNKFLSETGSLTISYNQFLEKNHLYSSVEKYKSQLTEP